MVTLSGGGFKGTESLTPGGGFRVAFERSDPGPLEQMQGMGIAVGGASVEAVVKTTEALKERVRDFIDAHFGNSARTSNNRRRASNAIQSKYYDELESKGQYAGLVYSKLGRGSGPASFVDYLLLHVRGGEITPNGGDWLRIANPAIGGAAGQAARTGRFDDVSANVFFVKSADGSKLYLLRKYGKGAPGSLGRSTQLIATLVKSVRITASLSGLEAILSEAPGLFDRNFDAALSAATTKGAGA